MSAWEKGSMKRYRIPALVLIFFVIIPNISEGNKLYFRTILGLNTGGRITEHLTAPPRYQDALLFERGSAVSLGAEIAFEFIYMPAPALGIALRYGYVMNSTIGEVSEFWPPYFNRPMLTRPELHFDANSLGIGPILSLYPVLRIRLNVSAGLDFYYFQVKSQSFWETGIWLLGGDLTRDRFELTYHRFGYRLGLDCDYNLSEVMDFSFGILYRSVIFSDPAIELESGFGSNLKFLRWLDMQDIPELEYRVSSIGFSGLGGFFGLKFRF
jgi:hypothetical protein